MLRGAVLFLDELLHYDRESLSAAINVQPNNPPNDEEGLPGWMGFEWMAQAAGAWMGAQQRDSGQCVDIGFLMGTRRYRGPDRFAPGRWYVHVSLVLFDNAAGVLAMDATLSASVTMIKPCASCRVTLFQPTDVAAFIESQDIFRK